MKCISFCHPMNSSITNWGIVMIENKSNKKTVIKIDKDIWNLAIAKAGCSGKELVEELLMDYIGYYDWDDYYNEKIAESQLRIKEQEKELKRYERIVEIMKKHNPETNC